MTWYGGCPEHLQGAPGLIQEPRHQLAETRRVSALCLLALDTRNVPTCDLCSSACNITHSSCLLLSSWEEFLLFRVQITSQVLISWIGSSVWRAEWPLVHAAVDLSLSVYLSLASFPCACHFCNNFLWINPLYHHLLPSPLLVVTSALSLQVSQVCLKICCQALTWRLCQVGAWCILPPHLLPPVHANPTNCSTAGGTAGLVVAFGETFLCTHSEECRGRRIR